MRSSRIAAAALGPALAALTTLSASTVHAGAWTREPGGWFLKLGYERWYTSARYDSSGSRISYLPPTGAALRSQYRSQALRAYAEYGLADDWTVTASTGYQWIEAEGEDRFDRTRGAADLTLQLKRRLIVAPLVVSLIGETKVPTGYVASHFPALGSGKTDLGGRVAVGASTARLYVTGEAGYLARGGVLADEVPYALETGVSIVRDVTVRGELRGSMTSGRASGGARFDPAWADSRYLGASGGLVLHGKPFDLVFDATRVLSGRNTLAGTRLGFSVWYSK